MNNNIPNVPVNDLLVHPRENDLVVATYGRGLFVTDIAPLEEMNEKVLSEEVYLFEVEPKTQRITHNFGANDYLFGDRHLITPNEPSGLIINYYLRNKAAGEINICVTNSYGEEIARLEGNADAGINTAVWDMRRPLAKQEGVVQMRRSWDIQSQWVPPGEYMIILEINGKRLMRKARITQTKGWSIGPFPEIVR
jgi:hypothetical protein